MEFNQYIFEKFDYWAYQSPWWVQEMIDDLHLPHMDKSIREAAVFEVAREMSILIARENWDKIDCKQIVEDWINSKIPEKQKWAEAEGKNES